MEVKRHFNRFLGSFRRKPHQNPPGIGATAEAFQSKDKQTASRWELLDFGEEECKIAQEKEQEMLAKAAQEYQLKHLQESLNPKNLEASNSQKSALLEDEEVFADLTRQNSNRLSRGISRSFRRLKSLKSTQSQQQSSPSSSSYAESSYPAELETPCYSMNADSSNITSVVHEINQTINLINEFKPVDHSFMSSPQTQPVNQLKSPQVIQFPVKFEDAEDSYCNEKDILGGMSMLNASNNPDLILSLDEVSRLTSTQNWTDFSGRKEIINQSENERMRTKSLFSPDDPFCTSKLGTYSSGNRESTSSNTRVLSSSIAKDTPGSSSNEPPSFSSSYSSRPWADEMEMPSLGTSSSAPAPLLSRSKSNILRRSGRKLYKKIHSRLAKKGEGETTVTGDEERRLGWEEALSSSSSYATTSATFHPDERNKEKEIKSIHSKSHSIEEANASASAAKIGNHRVGLKRTRSSRLSHSFRKVISFPRRSSFTLLESKNNNDRERNDTDKKMSQNSYGEDYRVLSLPPTKDPAVVTLAQKSSEGETLPPVTSAIIRRRSLSFRAFQTPVKGMNRMLRKGVSALGKSMMYASLATPMGATELPMAPSKYPDAYWGDDEDYFYEFRRYCQTNSSSEMYYNQRASNIPGAGIVQRA